MNGGPVDQGKKLSGTRHMLQRTEGLHKMMVIRLKKRQEAA